ncbi:MAG: ASKHA domain-containing protein [Candidatus Bathyarchaeia archaeon]
MKVRVKFLPEGKRTVVKPGLTILEAAEAAGVDLLAICGGEGTCGRCRVRVTAGGENLQQPQPQESRQRSAGTLGEGERLACLARFTGDIAVEVPEESRSGNQKLMVLGLQPAVPLDPAIRKLFVELSPPTLAESTADDERLMRSLIQQLQAENQPLSSAITMGLSALRKLPTQLREGRFRVTAVLWNSERILDVDVSDTHRSAYGLAVDVGTTKLAVFLVDLTKGTLLYADGVVNPQIIHGEDLMSRISYAAKSEDNTAILHKAVVGAVNDLLHRAYEATGIRDRDVYEVVVAGNTAMHHMFLGVTPKFTGLAPYPSAVASALDLRAEDIGVHVHPEGNVHILPNVAGFVGGDAVADMLASKIWESEELMMIVDVGTNSEIILGNKQRILCCSAAAGPTFEGACIKHGMRAAPGAIEKVHIHHPSLEVEYRTIYGGKPRGICGSGIIDTLAEMLRTGLLDTSGRIQTQLKHPRLRTVEGVPEFVVAWREESGIPQHVSITQRDVREAQKAKAAIHTGCALLMERLKVSPSEIHRLMVAGAFGSYLNPTSAMTIGMLPEVPLDRIVFMGNAAGAGARMALISREMRETARQLARLAEHLELAAQPDFQEEYLNSLDLPHADPSLYPHVASSVRAPRVLRFRRKRSHAS